MQYYRISRPAGLLLITLLVLCHLTQSCLGQPNKVQYELDEKCGTQATAIFEKDWHGNGIVNTKDGQIVANFENHYNPTLNKCFYLLTSTSYLTKATPLTSNVSIILLDVNDNREIGEFMENQHQDKPIWCFVGKITCHSKDEMAELDQALYGTMTARWQI